MGGGDAHRRGSWPRHTPVRHKRDRRSRECDHGRHPDATP
jgi:hypothetical protein